MTDSRVAEINVVSDEGYGVGIEGGGAESGDSPNRERLGSATGHTDCQVALSQLGINSHLHSFLKGSDSGIGSSALYCDIIEDIKNMKATSSPSSSSASQVDYDSYFGLSKISSCYRKHTQSSASQSSPLFKISFTGSIHIIFLCNISACRL